MENLGMKRQRVFRVGRWLVGVELLLLVGFVVERIRPRVIPDRTLQLMTAGLRRKTRCINSKVFPIGKASNWTDIDAACRSSYCKLSI